MNISLFHVYLWFVLARPPTRLTVLNTMSSGGKCHFFVLLSLCKVSFFFLFLFFPKLYLKSPVENHPQSTSRELRRTKDRERFDLITPEEFFWADLQGEFTFFLFVSFGFILLLFFWFVFVWKGTMATSDADREQHHSGSVCLLVLFFSFSHFELLCFPFVWIFFLFFLEA